MQGSWDWRYEIGSICRSILKRVDEHLSIQWECDLFVHVLQPC